MGNSYYLSIAVKVIKEQAMNRRLVLFGAGDASFKALLYYLGDIEVSYCCDNNKNKWGTDFYGIKVYSPEKLKEENPNDIFVLVASMYWGEIGLQLDGMGIEWTTLHTPNGEKVQFYKNVQCFIKGNHEKVCRVLEMLADEESKRIYNGIIERRKAGIDAMGVYSEIHTSGPQYFRKEIFGDYITDNEVYVDAGLYNTDTLEGFIKFVNNRYEMIYGFEPDMLLYNKIRAKFTTLPDKIKLLPYALSNKSGEVQYNARGDSKSAISEYGNHMVKSAAIDEIIEGKVTFIKLDTEGSELEVLMGARGKIAEYKPKLAVSIYHKLEDLWEIPLFIKELVPEYKFSIRHHSVHYAETVLYARV